MAMRVATFSMNSRMLSASLQTQARMAEMQLQEASGTVSQDYGGLGSNSRKLISLEVAATRAKSYESSGTDAGTRVEMMYGTLSSVSDLLTDFRTQLIALQSTSVSDTARESTVSAAESYMQELAGLLNTEYAGRYLFSGGATSTAPVDLSGFDVVSADTSDTSYYQGGADRASVLVAEGQSVTYGINANDSAFEKAFRALGLVAAAGSSLDDDTISAALDLLVEAVDATAAVQGRLSVGAAAIERAVSSQQDVQSFLETGISSIRDVDVTALTAQLTTYETQLQASYAALAKVQSLNLLDYIR